MPRRPQARPSVPRDLDRLHDEAAALFQPRTTRKLTREDGREITRNMVGLFTLLLEWDRAERAAQPKELNHE